MVKTTRKKYYLTCCKCKKKVDEVWEIGPYSHDNKTLVKYQDKEYCEDCYNILLSNYIILYDS